MASTSKLPGSMEWPAMQGPLSCSTPIVTIFVKGGAKFCVHKTVLTQNSAYFDKAVNGPFLEGNTQSINLDDIHPEAFGGYVNVLYQVVLSQKASVKLYDADAPEHMQYCSMLSVLRFWQLADRFLDIKMRAIAEDAIDYRFGHYSVSKWEEYYERNDTASEFIVNRFTNLQNAFRLCKEDIIPYQDQIVTALANCPPQVFAEHVEHLDEDFKTAVTKAFALRHVERRDSKKGVKRQRQSPRKTGTPKRSKLGED